MTLQQYFQGALVLPVATPFVVEPLRFALPEAAARWLSLPGLALIVAGVPYVAFALVSIRYIRARPGRDCHLYVVGAPLVFSAFLFVLAAGLSAAISPTGQSADAAPTHARGEQARNLPTC